MENKNRVPITLRDLFWQDPFFSTNWDDFSKIHEDMMAETRSIWQKFDQQLKHFEAKTPEPIPEDIKVILTYFFQFSLRIISKLFLGTWIFVPSKEADETSIAVQ